MTERLKVTYEGADAAQTNPGAPADDADAGAKEQAQQVTGQAKEQAQPVAGEAKDKAITQVDEKSTSEHVPFAAAELLRIAILER